jgi:hypothetical protein
MSMKKIKVVDGFGMDTPREVAISNTETAKQFKTRAAKSLDLAENEIDISTETRIIEDDETLANAVTKRGNILFITPRTEGY